MRRIISLIGAGALGALCAMPAAATHGDRTVTAAHGAEPTIVVMQHICGPDIQTEADFVAAEDAGAGGEPGGDGTLPGLVATVLACPTVFLPSDTGTGGIASDPTEFDYTVGDSAGASYALSDAMFMAAELCETDIALDANGNGEIEDDVCLDVSMYQFSPVAEGAVTVTQTQAPGNTRFGTIRFTPASTDDMTLLSASAGVLEFDTSADTQVDDPPLPLAEYNDDVVVAHVYNFQNVEGSMPNSATTAPASSTLPVTLLGFAAVIALIGGAVLVTRRSRA